MEHKQKQQKHPMCVETTNRHLESQFGLTFSFFPVLVLLPSRVRILGWMGPHWALWPCGRAGVWWAAQWNVCRAGGAAGPLWPHSPTLHGYRGLYGSPRTACWHYGPLMAAGGAGGPLVMLQPTSPGVTLSTFGSLANEEHVCIF